MCIWYVMSISGMLFPYLVCYSHHGWLVQPSMALKKNLNPPWQICTNLSVNFNGVQITRWIRVNLEVFVSLTQGQIQVKYCIEASSPSTACFYCSWRVCSDVQGLAWPESPGFGLALEAQTYQNLRLSLGAWLGLGQGFARTKQNKAVRHVNSWFEVENSSLLS